jgi:hypothetical protein
VSFPNPNLYRILAYFRGPDKTPEKFGSTGCFVNAEKNAKDVAAEGYKAVVVNTETCARYEYLPEEVATASG